MYSQTRTGRKAGQSYTTEIGFLFSLLIVLGHSTSNRSPLCFHWCFIVGLWLNSNIFSSGNTPGVRNLIVKPSLPCDKAKISLWEQRNACLLPDDVRAFYMSCDGFKLTWSYKVEGELIVRGGRQNSSNVRNT